MMDRHLRRWFKDFSLKQKIRTWILQQSSYSTLRQYNNGIEVIKARNCQDTKHRK